MEGEQESVKSNLAIKEKELRKLKTERNKKRRPKIKIAKIKTWEANSRN